MAKPSDHAGFRAKQKFWYRLLAETGFKDLEHPSGNLKQRASNAYRGAGQEQREAKLNFFMKVARRAAHTQFPDKAEKIIMESFADGIKQVDIRKKLAAKSHHNSRAYVWRVISQWLKTWNLK